MVEQVSSEGPDELEGSAGEFGAPEFPTAPLPIERPARHGLKPPLRGPFPPKGAEEPLTTTGRVSDSSAFPIAETTDRTEGARIVSAVNPFPATAIATIEALKTTDTVLPTYVTPAMRSLGQLRSMFLERHVQAARANASFVGSEPDRPRLAVGGVVLLHGNYGMGKTHTLRHVIGDDPATDAGPLEVYAKADDARFPSAHQRLLSRIPRDDLRKVLLGHMAVLVSQLNTGTSAHAHKLLRSGLRAQDIERAISRSVVGLGSLVDRHDHVVSSSIASSSSQEEVVRALRYFMIGSARAGATQDLVSISHRWLCGLPLSPPEREAIGVQSALSPVMCAMVIVLLAKACTQIQRPLIVYIDQYDQLFPSDPAHSDQLAENQQVLRDLVERLPRDGGMLVLSGTRAAWQALPLDLKTRLTSTIDLSFPNTRALLATYIRSDDSDEGDSIAPLTDETLPILRRKSGGNVRQLLQLCHLVFDRVLFHGDELDKKLIVSCAQRQSMQVSLDACKAAVTQEALARGLPISREYRIDEGAPIDFAIGGTLDSPRWLIEAEEAIFYRDEALHAIQHAATIRRLLRSPLRPTVVLVVVGYVTPEVSEELARLVDTLLIYDSDLTFRASFGRLLDVPASAAPSLGRISEEAVAGVEARLEALVNARTAHLNALQERLEELSLKHAREAEWESDRRRRAERSAQPTSVVVSNTSSSFWKDMSWGQRWFLLVSLVVTLSGLAVAGKLYNAQQTDLAGALARSEASQRVRRAGIGDLVELAQAPDEAGLVLRLIPTRTRELIDALISRWRNAALRIGVDSAALNDLRQIRQRDQPTLQNELYELDRLGSFGESSGSFGQDAKRDVHDLGGALDRSILHGELAEAARDRRWDTALELSRRASALESSRLELGVIAAIYSRVEVSFQASVASLQSAFSTAEEAALSGDSRSRPLALARFVAEHPDYVWDSAIARRLQELMSSGERLSLERRARRDYDLLAPSVVTLREVHDDWSGRGPDRSAVARALVAVRRYLHTEVDGQEGAYRLTEMGDEVGADYDRVSGIYSRGGISALPVFEKDDVEFYAHVTEHEESFAAARLSWLGILGNVPEFQALERAWALAEASLLSRAATTSYDDAFRAVTGRHDVRSYPLSSKERLRSARRRIERSRDTGLLARLEALQVFAERVSVLDSRLVPVVAPRAYLLGDEATEEGVYRRRSTPISAGTLFMVDKFEVDVESYALFLAVVSADPKHRGYTKCSDDCDHIPDNWAAQREGRQNPVVGISWRDASAFASLSGRRLPTADEWELTARVRREGGASSSFREFPDSIGLCPIGSSQESSPWGVFDMAGNAGEFTSSYFDAAEDLVIYCGPSVSCPRQEVFRLLFLRPYLPATERRMDLGFRCVLEGGE